MSITASIAMTPTSVTPPGRATATLTINNASATAVTVISVSPKATPNGVNPTSVAALLGQCVAGRQGFALSVPGSGAATTTFEVCPLAPPSGVYATNPFPSGITPAVPLAQPAQQVLAIGADVLVSDGSTAAATTATLTVNGMTR